MQIKRLRIDNYRCLVGFDIEFVTASGGSSTILIGENGTGKSTMIECILDILMSFDSPAIEERIDYNYSIDYEYAQKAISITKTDHSYRITVDLLREAIRKCVPLPKSIPYFLSVLLYFILGQITNFCPI